ncbi:MAG: hypothetical protein VX830_16070 [Candidatus Poribacteria bacterium]|nr:hypothetical protein [Candidatus Poribacteria bacterium]
MKHRILIAISIVFFSVLSLAFLPHLVAQVGQRFADQEPERQLKSILKGWKLIEAVIPSDEDQAIALMSNFNQIEHLRSEFRTRDRSNFDLIQQLATEEGKIQEKKEILNEYLGNREKYAQKRDLLYRELLDSLNPDQQIRFMVFDRTFRKELRNTVETLSKLKEMESNKKEEK